MSKFFIILSILFLSSSALFSQKTDTLVHINGNIITGEIKKIEYGLLYFSTDGMGTIEVETEKIKSLKSHKQFQIIRDNGLLYFGSFDTVNGLMNRVKIVSRNQPYIVNIKSIVEVFPVKKSFWLRTYGNFSLGGNYTKSSRILQLNFSGNLNYRGRKNYYNISWDNQATMSGDSLLSEKKTNAISYQRYFQKHYSFQSELGISSNNELNLKSRFYLSLIGGKDIIHTNRSELFSGIGVSGNKEETLDSSLISNNIEGIIKVSYDFFKRSSPEINIITSLNAYPSFSVSKRLRVDSSIEARIEVFSDFFVGIKVYDNFDNKLHLSSESNNDWGVNGTISYSFH